MGKEGEEHPIDVGVADEEHAQSFDLFKHFPDDLPKHPLQRSGAHRREAADILSDFQGFLKKEVELCGEGACFCIGYFDLPLDVCLAENRAVEAGGDFAKVS